MVKNYPDFRARSTAWAAKFQRTKGERMGNLEMTDLDKLIAEVEAGTIPRHDLDAFIPWRGLDSLTSDCLDAYNGSLDAAKRLHDALLPGWDFDVTNGSAFVVNPDKWDWGFDAPTQFQADNADPARAWLLAILRALSHLTQGES